MAKKNVRDEPLKPQVTENEQMSDIVLILDKMELLLQAVSKLDKDGNLVPVPVKVGDKVVYGKFGGTEINVEGEDVLILRGDDLYAVFA